MKHFAFADTLARERSRRHDLHLNGSTVVICSEPSPSASLKDIPTHASEIRR
jgi:hypothetical protein